MTALAQPMTRTRRYAFRGLVVVMAALAIVLFWVALAFPVVAWMPDSVLDELLGTAGAGIHRIHAVGFSVQLWLMVGGIALQLHRPRRKVAVVWMVGFAFAISTVIEIVIGTFDPSELVFLILFAILAWIHPGDLQRRPHPVRGRLVPVAWLGATGMVVFAWIQLGLQMSGGAGNPHVALGHYGGMAAAGLMVAAAALIAATDAPGARIVAWFAGLGTVFYGIASAVYPGHASSLGTGWGVAAAIWGAVFVLVSEYEAGATSQEAEAPTLEGVAMRYESSVTSISWIPSEAVTGLVRPGFELLGHYDPAPPDRLEDLEELRRSDRFRFANSLQAWIEVENGRVVGHGQTGRGWIGSTTLHLGSRAASVAAVPYPDLRPPDQVRSRASDSPRRPVEGPAFPSPGRCGVRPSSP